MYKVLKVKDKKVYLGDERNNLKIIPFENFDFIPEIGDSIELFKKDDIIIPQKREGKVNLFLRILCT